MLLDLTNSTLACDVMLNSWLMAPLALAVETSEPRMTYYNKQSASDNWAMS